MGTEILKSFNSLQSELEQAKSSLKGVDENIKRLIGRDPSEPPPRPGAKRGPPNDDKSRNRNVRNRNYPHENDEPPNKRRNSSGVSVFKRLSDRPMPETTVQKQIISKVIVTPKEIPSRQEALAAQSKDEKSKARNRRMFGALLGTLQKFQQEETKLKHKEDKRAQLEKKIEEHEIKEKQEIKKERQELFLNRRKKQAEIKVIELKMLRMKEYSYWEEKHRPLGNFIATKAKPQINFLPRRLNDTTKAQLVSSKAEIEKMIEKKKSDVLEELKQIEERMKKNFDHKKTEKEENHIEEPMEHEEINHSSQLEVTFHEESDTTLNDASLNTTQGEALINEESKIKETVNGNNLIEKEIETSTEIPKDEHVEESEVKTSEENQENIVSVEQSESKSTMDWETVNNKCNEEVL